MREFSRSRGRKLSFGAIAAVAALAAIPVSANADAITYTDGGNVWLASPDGAVKKKVTTNATKDLKYFGPSQANNGKIAVIWGKLSKGLANLQVLTADGKLEKTGLLQMSTCGAFGQFPTTFGETRIDPAGKVIAYDYMCINHQSGSGINRYVAVVSANQPGGFVGGEPLQIQGYWRPDWLPTTAAGGAAPDMVVTGPGGGSLAKLSWVNPPDPQDVFESDPADSETSIGAASVSRTGNILTYTISEADGTYSIHVARLSGPFRPGVDATGCRLLNSPDQVRPSISPDGKQVAWSDEGGAKVATVTIPGGGPGQACAASTKLISRSGLDPVFSGAARPSNDSGPRALAVRGPARATRSQVRKGLTFSTKCAARCSVRGRMSAGAKTVASASRKLKKKGTAKLKLRARLARTVDSVQVVITSGSRSATVTIAITG